MSNATQTFSKEYDGGYIDLADRGEQVAHPSVIGGVKVLFITFQPVARSTDLCSRLLGIGYEIRQFGRESTESEEIAAFGIPIHPAIVTLLLPFGLPYCEENHCLAQPEDQCASVSDSCKVVTLYIGPQGFG